MYILLQFLQKGGYDMKGISYYYNMQWQKRHWKNDNTKTKREINENTISLAKTMTQT